MVSRPLILRERRAERPASQLPCTSSAFKSDFRSEPQKKTLVVLRDIIFLSYSSSTFVKTTNGMHVTSQVPVGITRFGGTLRGEERRGEVTWLLITGIRERKTDYRGWSWCMGLAAAWLFLTSMLGLRNLYLDSSLTRGE